MGYHVHYPPIDDFFCQMHMDIILPIWDFTSNYIDMLKESLYTEEPMRQQKNLVIFGYRVEFY